MSDAGKRTISWIRAANARRMLTRTSASIAGFGVRIATSIAQTATFTFRDSADLERYMRGQDPDIDREEYGRYGNPTVRELETRVAALDEDRPSGPDFERLAEAIAAGALRAALEDAT